MAKELNNELGATTNRAARLPKGIFAAIWLVWALLSVKAWWIDVYKIKGSSMENTLLPGDWVLCNKWNPHPQRNELVLFKFPGQKPQAAPLFIKRCIGLPGDLVEICGRQLRVNNRPFANAPGTKFKYFVRTPAELDARVFSQFDIARFIPVDNGYIAYASEENAAHLAYLNTVVAVLPKVQQKGRRVSSVFPHSNKFDWNKDYFGPLLVPRKGWAMPISPYNLALYGNTIAKHEGWGKVEIRQNELIIDGKQMDSYTFQKNYYFVLGDNRHNSHDSRSWGLLPENYLIGKPQTVVFSTGQTNDKTLQWHKMRWFKGIE